MYRLRMDSSDTVLVDEAPRAMNHARRYKSESYEDQGRSKNEMDGL